MKKIGCKVKFADVAYAKEYSYLTDIENMKSGDLIVVHAKDEFVLAYFSRYDETVEEKETTKWVISKVDLSMHYARIAKKQKAKKLKEELKKEADRTQELQFYKILAKENPKIKELLDELEGLEF